MNRKLLPVFTIVLVNMLGIGIILPLLPYYAQTFGADATAIGFLLAAYATFQFFSAPFLGRLSDRIGRKPVLIVSELGAAAGYVVLAFAPTLAFLFVGRIVAGLFAGNIPVAQAAAVDVTPPQDRAKTFGVLGSAFGIGFIIGPALGASLSTISYSLPALIAAALSVLAAILVVVLLPETRGKRAAAAYAQAAPAAGAEHGRHGGPAPAGSWKSALRKAMSRPVLGVFLGVLLVYTFGFAVYQSTFVQVMDFQFGLSVQQAGFFLMYGGILIVVAQLALLPRLVKRFSDRQRALAGMAILGSGALMTAMLSSWEPLIISSTLVTLGAATANPSMLSILSNIAGDNERGTILGLNSSISSLANIFAPVIGGILIAQVASNAPMILTSLCVLAGLIGAAILFSRWKAPAASPATAPHAAAPAPAPAPLAAPKAIGTAQARETAEERELVTAA